MRGHAGPARRDWRLLDPDLLRWSVDDGRCGPAAARPARRAAHARAGGRPARRGAGRARATAGRGRGRLCGPGRVARRPRRLHRGRPAVPPRRHRGHRQPAAGRARRRPSRRACGSPGASRSASPAARRPLPRGPAAGATSQSCEAITARDGRAAEGSAMRGVRRVPRASMPRRSLGDGARSATPSREPRRACADLAPATVLRAAAERLLRHPFQAWFYGDSVGFEGLAGRQ